MTDKYILFGGGVARDIVVRMVLAEADIPHEVRFVDGVTGEHRTDEFKRMNPAGYIPALVTPEGETLFETAAILLHLVEKHEMTDLVPMPGDPDRGRFLSCVHAKPPSRERRVRRMPRLLVGSLSRRLR